MIPSPVKVPETTLWGFPNKVLYYLHRYNYELLQSKSAWSCWARELSFTTNALWNTWFFIRCSSVWKTRQDKGCQNTDIKTDRALNTSSNGINPSPAFHQQALKMKRYKSKFQPQAYNSRLRCLHAHSNNAGHDVKTVKGSTILDQIFLIPRILLAESEQVFTFLVWFF